ncbi:TonB-dependent receptor [Phenylobacterium sp.]|uniref:TonB-dependent receptor n=1 Tax=Phenylobacterium sp. TaxID=1871053 RepID=UPI002FCC568B
MKMRKMALLGGIACGALLSLGAQAAAAEDAPSKELAEVVVTGSRLSDTIQTFPGSYSVVGEEAIAGQLATTRDIATVLAFNVPGLAQGNGTAANVEQGLRGRPVRIFIDGIPISNPLRDGGRDVRLIAPSALARIEVIRGASALYGQGGAGGIINYITKSGSAADEWAFRSEAGTSVSTTHRKGSFRPYVFQSATGAIGGFDVNINGSYERVNSVFDANGRRLPPDPQLFGGIADSDIYNLFGKVGYNFGDDQRLEAMINFYQQEQDTDYVLVPGSVATRTPTSTVKGAQDPRALNQENRNIVSYLAYTKGDVLGSSFHAQLYYVENYGVFGFEPARLGGTQTTIDSEKIGLQTDFRTKLGFLGFEDGLVLWGVDINRDTTEQPLLPLTNIPGDGRTFAPPMEQTNYAAFVQVELPVTDRLTFRAGVRHDEFRLKTDPFVAGLTGVRVDGGELEYQATPINLGGTFQLTEAIQLFGGFSQGFSVPDVGAPLRNARFTSLEALKPEAAMVDNYEIGLRGRWSNIRFTAAYFQSRSELGTDFVIDPLHPTEAQILREKERIEGVELTVDGDFGPETRWGANLSWAEGKRDATHDGKLDTPLTGRRISPEQFNAYLEHDITPDWLVRVQMAYTGSRNKFPGSPVGAFYTGKVEPTTRIDAMTEFKVDRADISIGVSNLLNSDYFPVTSQMLNRNDRYSKAEGRTLFVRVGVNY